jgi:hypothetical protein
MASSSNDFTQYEVKGARVDEEKTFDGAHPRRSSVVGSVREVGDNTHRKLKSRHIQLIGIGGTIGTALYVQIGRGLMNGGPASLFIAFTLWYAHHTYQNLTRNRLIFTGALSFWPLHSVRSPISETLRNTSPVRQILPKRFFPDRPKQLLHILKW